MEEMEMEMDMDMSMQMTFYTGHEVTILFSWWETQTQAQYALSLLVIFIAGIAMELLMLLKRILGFRSKSLLWKAVNSVLFGVVICWGYFMMLAAMTYNVGVFVVVCVGYAVGNFIFSQDAFNLFKKYQ